MWRGRPTYRPEIFEDERTYGYSPNKLTIYAPNFRCPTDWKPWGNRWEGFSRCYNRTLRDVVRELTGYDAEYESNLIGTTVDLNQLIPVCSNNWGAGNRLYYWREILQLLPRHLRCRVCHKRLPAWHLLHGRASWGAYGESEECSRLCREKRLQRWYPLQREAKKLIKALKRREHRQRIQLRKWKASNRKWVREALNRLRQVREKALPRV